MAQGMKEELRRERLREYDAALLAARTPVAVLVLFARARELRARGERLEEAFAATSVDGVDDVDLLPAGVWVALRQGDIDATIEALLRASKNEIVLAAHEQVDASYRLTTVEERRTLPDVDPLQAQVANFLQIPGDVVAMVASWGEDDPRTVAEVETLIEQRSGSAATNARPASTAPAQLAPPVAAGDGAELSMSSKEFTALLNLTPDQRAVLDTLVRQTAITISADRP
ncbi:MAG: hypothetical protein QOK10_95 [Pseudonocardiales bacterium]|nr:hypothetical protein [Pseudonocardiales bacterium]